MAVGKEPEGPGLNVAGRTAAVFGGVLPGVAAGTIAVMLPRISDAFGNADNALQVKMVATAAGLGMMVGAPLGGALSDRWGRMPVLAVTTLVFGLAGCGAFFAGALWHLIAARFIVGICSGAMSVCYLALIGDSFTGEAQGRWLGYNGALATFFLLMLNPATGALADMGWRYGFLVYGLAFPTLALVFAGVPRSAPHRAASAGTPAADDVFRMPWATMILAVVAGTIATGTTLYWPFRLREIGVTSARDLGLYALPNVLAVGSSGFLYGYLRRRLTIRQVFVLTGLCSATGLVTIAFAPVPWVVMIGLAVEGIAVGLMTPNLSMFTIGMSTPRTRARTMGVMKGVYFGSPFLTQFVLEGVSQRSGPSAALLCIAVMSLGFAVFMLTRPERSGPQ